MNSNIICRRNGMRRSARVFYGCLFAFCYFFQSNPPNARCELDRRDYASGEELDGVPIQRVLSKDGAKELIIDPTSVLGGAIGGAEYTLTSSKVLIWKSRLPFLLKHPLVTETGQIIGVAFERSDNRTDGIPLLRLAGIDATGKVLFDYRWERRFVQSGGFGWIPPRPLPTQLILDSDNDRIILRVRSSFDYSIAEDWHIIRLSSGAIINSVSIWRPKNDKGERLYEIKGLTFVRGTPLVLIQWENATKTESSPTGFLVLIDQMGRVHWTRELRGAERIENNSLEDSNTDVPALSVRQDKWVIKYKVAGHKNGEWQVTETKERTAK